MEVLDAAIAAAPQAPEIGDLRLSEVDHSAVLCQIFALRIESWKTFIHIDPTHTEWADEFETISRHWALFDGETPIAAARLTVCEDLSGVPDAAYYKGIFANSLRGPIGSFNRMCVDPKYRGNNLSLLLDEVRLDAARKQGCRSLIVATSAGPRRIAQLESIGFKFVSMGRKNTDGPLTEAPSPHVMLLQLPE